MARREMEGSDRPPDRIRRKPGPVPSPTARVVQMKLEQDLIDAIEVMAADCHRKFHGMIDAALHWACWAHSHGRSPDREMVGHHHPGGYLDWDEKIRAKRETRELRRLYELREHDEHDRT
jgi:hypothetical protein